MIMLFAKKIRRLREDQQLIQLLDDEKELAGKALEIVMKKYKNKIVNESTNR